MSRMKKATVEDKFYEIFEGMSTSDQDGVFKILRVIQSLSAMRNLSLVMAPKKTQDKHPDVSDE